MAPASNWPDVANDTVDVLIAADVCRVPGSFPVVQNRRPKTPQKVTPGRRDGDRSRQAKAGSRRANRSDNDTLRGHPIAKDIKLTADDVYEIYNPYVEWRSAIGNLFDNPKALAAFEPFLNVSMEEEQRFLAATAKRNAGGSDSGSDDGWERIDNEFVVVMTPADMLARVDRRLLKLLHSARFSDEAFLRDLELRFKKHASTSANGAPLRIEVDGPFYRLLCHGMAQFYGLSSKGTSDGKGGRDVIVAGLVGVEAARIRCDVSLVDTLAA